MQWVPVVQYISLTIACCAHKTSLTLHNINKMWLSGFPHIIQLCGIKGQEFYSNNLSSRSWLHYSISHLQPERGEEVNSEIGWYSVLLKWNPADCWPSVYTIFTSLIDINISHSGSCITFGLPGFHSVFLDIILHTYQYKFSLVYLREGTVQINKYTW